MCEKCRLKFRLLATAIVRSRTCGISGSTSIIIFEWHLCMRRVKLSWSPLFLILLVTPCQSSTCCRFFNFFDHAWLPETDGPRSALQLLTDLLNTIPAISCSASLQMEIQSKVIPRRRDWGRSVMSRSIFGTSYREDEGQVVRVLDHVPTGMSFGELQFLSGSGIKAAYQFTCETSVQVVHTNFNTLIYA